MADTRKNRQSNKLADLFGRRSTPALLETSGISEKVKNYRIDVPSIPSSDEEDDIKADIREYNKLKAHDDARRMKKKSDINCDKSAREKRYEESSIEKSFKDQKLERKSPKPILQRKQKPTRELISTTMLLTDYDCAPQDTGNSIFKSYDYQQLGNFSDSLLQSKREKPKTQKNTNPYISIETGVFQVTITGTIKMQVCALCDGYLNNQPHVRHQRQATNVSQGKHGDKSTMLRKASRPAVLNNKSSNVMLGDLCGKMAKTEKCRSISRSSIEKPGNYVKPGFKYKYGRAQEISIDETMRSKMRNSIDSTSKIFKTSYEPSSKHEYADLRKSLITSTLGNNKENRSSIDSQISKRMPSTYKNAGVPQKIKLVPASAMSRNDSKKSYTEKYFR